MVKCSFLAFHIEWWAVKNAREFDPYVLALLTDILWQTFVPWKYLSVDF